MRIHSVHVKNFRLLADAPMELEPRTTLIVGRNNSGKTSLSEVMRRMLEAKDVKFALEDFSNACYEKFCDALSAKNAGADEVAIRALLPAIELRVVFRYGAEQMAPVPPQPAADGQAQPVHQAQPAEITDMELGALSPFVVDLNENCTEALAVIRYELKDGGIEAFFDGQPTVALDDKTRVEFFKLLRDRIPALYAVRIWAEDPNDPDNRRELQPAALRQLVKTGCINAQRGLDDVTHRETDVLAKVLERLFTTASSKNAAPNDKVIADALTAATKDIQEQVDKDFKQHLDKLMPALESFGYPGLDGQELQTETKLDIGRLLTNFTKVQYAGHNGVALPEAYNGLGTRNLIYILLKLVDFYKTHCAEPAAPGVHLLFIEEPEAHLHPQMQEVFIRQLNEIVKLLVESSEDDTPWPVQFVVTTHSSHIANAAGFESIRYFVCESAPTNKVVRATKIKDLRKGLSGNAPADNDFLHQYLTLTRCDLFFADKAILIEGTGERLLVPVCIKKLEAENTKTPKLSTQYTTMMEVGGAYAHLFFKLLDFLELQYLVITDIDAVVTAGGAACPPHHQGAVSSNACLNAWFVSPGAANPTIVQLQAKLDDEKIKGKSRISYQCPEAANGPCGRSLEEAFILANANKFGITAANSNDAEIAAMNEAKKKKKTDFALHYAIRDTSWTVPKYLREGLMWLAGSGVQAASTPTALPAPLKASAKKGGKKSANG